MAVKPILFVYKEVSGGDLRKLLAESNDSPTGGGARDLRFPLKTFRSVMHRIFTEDVVGRGGKPIRRARVSYVDAHDVLRSTTLDYWPATTARPAEDRIAAVHDSPALGGRLPDTDKGRVFVVLTKYDDGDVRCDYAYEHELKDPTLWSVEASSQILGCMASAALQGGHRSVQGYYDFLTGTRHCHAE